MKIRSVVCYSLSLPTREPMAYLRLIAPFQQTNVHLINGIQKGRVRDELIADGDIVIIQREFPKRFDDYKRIANTAKQKGKSLVFELDDLLFFLPQEHPDRLDHDFVSALLPMLYTLLDANVVVVSTNKLKDVLSAYHKNIVVIPNYLDDDLWALKKPVYKKNEVLTIGYMGTNSHKPDLDYIAPVLVRLSNRYPQKIRFLFIGPQPPSSLLVLPQVEWIPFFSYSYEEFAAYFQTLSIDIAIAPLVDNLFNRCKSPIKFFEYTALGTPGVYSCLPPYKEVIQHQYDGLLATTLDEWEKYLVRLIEEDDERFQLAVHAQSTINEKWLLSRNALHGLNTLEQALGIKLEENNILMNILESLSIQQSESFHILLAQVNKYAQEIQYLTTRVSEQEQNVQQLKEEIVNYALSWSWQITRPFRKISKKWRYRGKIL